MPKVTDMALFQFWAHFLALEADFSATARYVEFAEDNYATYSVAYAKLLLSIGSEVDVLCRTLCKVIDPEAKPNKMDDYRAILKGRSYIAKQTVFIHRYNLKFVPWRDWGGDGNPTWWRSYNKVKHERGERYKEANLGNCANAIAGLFVLVLYTRRAKGERVTLSPRPVLLNWGQEEYPSTDGGIDYNVFRVSKATEPPQQAES